MSLFSLLEVIGLIDGVLQEKTYLRKIYGDEKYSAIQLTTASGACQYVLNVPRWKDWK